MRIFAAQADRYRGEMPKVSHTGTQQGRSTEIAARKDCRTERNRTEEEPADNREGKAETQGQVGRRKGKDARRETSPSRKEGTSKESRLRRELATGLCCDILLFCLHFVFEKYYICINV